MSAKGSGVLSLDGRGTYPSTLPESPKFSSADYISSSSHGYGHKSDQLFAEKIPDYPAIDRRTYGERQGAYMGRDMQGDPAPRYVDSVSFSHQHQVLIFILLLKFIFFCQFPSVFLIICFLLNFWNKGCFSILCCCLDNKSSFLSVV